MPAKINEEVPEWVKEIDPLDLNKDHKLASIKRIDDSDSGTRMWEWEGSFFHLLPISWYHMGDMNTVPFRTSLIFFDPVCSIAYYASKETWLGELLPLYYKIKYGWGKVAGRFWGSAARYLNRWGIMYTMEGAPPMLQDLFKKRLRKQKYEEAINASKD